MKRAVQYVLIAGLVFAAAFLGGHGKAMAYSCTLSSPATFGNLIANYDPTAASNSYTIPTNTIKATCTIDQNGSSVKFWFLGTSSTYGIYTAPFLTSGSNHLNFQLCTTSAACTSNFWNATTNPVLVTGINAGTNVTVTIQTAIAVNVPTGQNIPIGSYGPVNLYFAFDCGHGGTFTQC